MNKRVKKLWVAALRSKAYKQGRMRLRRGDKFCCMGVLCNLHAQAHPEIAATQLDPDVYLHCEVRLPITVQAWAGLSSVWGDRVTIGGLCASLTNHNDLGGTGATFAKIADAIEEQL